MNSQTMVHIAFPDGLRLIEKLYNDKLLDIALIELRPPMTACQSHQNGVVKIPTSMCFTIELSCLPPPDVAKWRPLWAALLEGGANVVFKSENKGHHIGMGGVITDSWELDDGMC